MNHTDRALSDILDALREISPTMFEHLVRRIISEGISGFIILALVISTIWFIAKALDVVDKKDREARKTPEKMNEVVACMYIIYAVLVIAITPALFFLAYNSLLNLLSPEGTALLRVLETIKQ